MLIANANLQQAFKRLIDFANDFSEDPSQQNAVIIICSEYNNLERDMHAGLLDYDKLRMSRSQLLNRSLSLVDNIAQPFNYFSA